MAFFKSTKPAAKVLPPRDVSPEASAVQWHAADEFRRHYGEIAAYTERLPLDEGFDAWMASSAIVLRLVERQPGVLLASIAAVRSGVMLAQLRATLRQAVGEFAECTVSAQLLQHLREATGRAGGGAAGAAAAANERRAQGTIYDAQFRELIERAIVSGASDIHFRLRNDGGESRGTVLLRIDSELEPVLEMSPVRMHELIAAAYAKSDANSLAEGEGQFNERRAMASFIRIPDARNVELRFQSAPERYGVDVAIRVLNYDGKISDTPDMASLGYLPDQIALLQEYGHGPGGGVIFAGQTGSGKTTALNALVASHPEVRAGTAYAATLEDPPEGRPPNVSQFAVARAAERGGTGDDNPFVAGLRVRMRSDGDILVMGEIRDSATAEIFSQLGMSGHKVFASFHAGSCRGSYERLVSRLMGLSHEIVASADVIGLTVFQQLVPKLCPRCRIPAREAWTTSIERSRLARLATLGIDDELLFVRNARGCPACNRGRVGVQVVAEMFTPDDAQRVLLAAGRVGEAFSSWRRRREADLLSGATLGKTAFEVALHFAARGVIGIDTVDALIGRISTYEEQRADD